MAPNTLSAIWNIRIPSAIDIAKDNMLMLAPIFSKYTHIFRGFE